MARIHEDPSMSSKPHCAANAFARRLITEGTIKGFPADCNSTDNSPVPGLKKALRTSLGPPGSRDQFNWMSAHAGEPLNCDGL